MNEQVLRQKIRNIQGNVFGLNNALFTMEALNFKLYPNNFAEHSLNTAMKAEKITCNLRHLISESGIVRSEYLMEEVADAQEIDVCRHGDGIFISLPRLLPKSVPNRSSNFLNQPLHQAISQFCADSNAEKFHDCAVCFVHVYDEKLSLNRIRDYDNTETRCVLNTISTFFLIDDSGQWCDVHHTTMLGNTDCTQIYIMPQEKFPEFISRLKYARNP